MQHDVPDDGSPYGLLAPELRERIARMVAQTHLPSLSALAATSQASRAAVAGARVRTPMGMRQRGRRTSARGLSRMGAPLAATDPMAVAAEAIRCVLQAYAAWYLDEAQGITGDSLLFGINPLMKEWDLTHPGERLSELPGVERALAPFGLSDLGAVPAVKLLRWITSNAEELSARGAPSIFTGESVRPFHAMGAAYGVVGKAPGLARVMHYVRDAAIPIEDTGVRHYGSFDEAAPHIDLVHRIDPRLLVGAMPGADPAQIEDWPLSRQPPLPQPDLVRAFADPAVGRRLLDWVDGQVDRYLTARCARAKRAEPDLFPRFSDLFAIDDLYVIPFGRTYLWGTLRPTFNVPAFLALTERMARQ